MASPTQWTWGWVDSGSWWWTGRPGVLQPMKSQRVGHDWATELNWTENSLYSHLGVHPWANREASLYPRISCQFSSIQSLSLTDSAGPWTAAHQASLSITNFQSLLKLMSITSVMPSNHHILCHPLLLPPSIFPNIRVFSNESVLCTRWPKYWNFSFNISPSNEYSGLICFRIHLFMWLCLILVVECGIFSPGSGI